MIKEYFFYDSYDWDNCGMEEEHDIEGDDYKRLITRLFRYSTCFSLHFTTPDRSRTRYPDWLNPILHTYDCDSDTRNNYPEYDKFIIKRIIERPPPDYLGTLYAHEIRFYRCCDETLEFLLTKFDSIFSIRYGFDFVFNPEDPYFYRADGSVIFASTTHEGECCLIPRDGEDFSDILTTPPWCIAHNITEDFYYERYCKFAHENMKPEEFNI